MKPQKFELHATIPRPREEVWEVLCNTERINRAVGLSPVEFEPVPLERARSMSDGLARNARSKLFNLVGMRWKEYPFQWVRPTSYSVLREYEAGPLARFVGGVELSEGGPSETSLHLFAEFTPANAVGRLALPLLGPRMLRRTLDYCNDTLRSVAANKALLDGREPTPTDFQRLNDAATKLASAPLDSRCLSALMRHLGAASDGDVVSMQPYRLAHLWEQDPDEVLRTCLYATKAGVLNLTWSLMCPNCRVPKAQPRSLGDVSSHFHCDTCGVDYIADFDRYVELRFSIHSAIRPAFAQTYCIGGPFLAPHVLIRQTIPRGGEATILFPDTQAELRIRVVRSPRGIRFDPRLPPSDSGALTFAFTDDGWQPASCIAPAAGTVLRFCNESGADIVLDLEKAEWDPYAVTALKVTSMQEFRDMFSSEVLAPGRHIGVEHLTLFFSDLRGSTNMYERSGDAPAYGRVRRHFDFLSERIATNNGSVVKTIGDAVMAVFHTPQDAVRASLTIQKDVARFNSEFGDGECVCIKIGLHHGPAICVNSNSVLDYFGRTVNIAARTTAQCRGDDIVLTEAVRDYPGVANLLADPALRVEAFAANLKGIEGDVGLWRVGLRGG